jgi:hypothetical protein
MTFLPVVARELRVAARRRTTYLARIGAALVSIVIAGFWLPVFAAQFTISQGQLLFSIISSLAFLYCLLAGARMTSDCLSAEKREGTIGLLFLTDLRGYDVILGKLVSCSLNAFYGLLGIVPVLALALLLGGVTLSEIGRMSLLFVNTLFFSMATGVFVSTISRNDRRAMFGTLCVIVLVTGGPYAVGVGFALARLSAGAGPNSFLDLGNVLLMSPALAFQLFHSAVFTAGIRRAFYTSILATHLLSWALLALASWVVPRVCRERPAAGVRLRWLAFSNRWSYGKAAKRRAFRAAALDRNAFYWLSARDRIKGSYVWFFVGALTLIWLAAALALGNFVFEWQASFWLLLMFLAFLKVWVTSEVCARLAEDRASGGFELLLSSPLSLPEMARGQTLALWRQFGKPAVVTLALTLFFQFSALRAPHDGIGSGEIRLLYWTLIITFLADVIALKWVATWKAITLAQIPRAMLGACARVLFLPTVAFAVLYGVYVLLRQASQNESPPSLGHAAALWLFLSLVVDLAFGLRARWQFYHHFREVVTQRYAGSKPGLEPFLEVLRSLRQRVAPWSLRGPLSPPNGVRWAQWALASFALAAVLAVGAFAFWKHTLQRHIAREFAAIRAAGDPVTVTELKDWGPLLGQDENAGFLFQKAASQMWSPVGGRGAVPPVKLEWPGPTAPVSRQLKANLPNYLARNREALRLLHEGAKLPRSRYPIYWLVPDPQMAPWQSLFRLRPAADLLQFEALLALENGDSAAALDSIEALFGLGHAMAQEPFLAALYDRNRYLNAALRALERLLNQRPLEPAELRQVDRQLRAAIDATGPAVVRALKGTRCFLINDLRGPGRAGWRGTAAPGIAKTLADLVDFTAGFSGFRDRELLKYLAAADRVIVRAQQIGVHDAAALAGAPQQTSVRDGSIAATEGYWQNTLLVQMEVVARLHTARTALALEQSRAAQGGRLPANLGALPAGPGQDERIDPFTSDSLRYVRLPKGYLVYSVGKDLEDNNGVDLPASGREGRFHKYDLTFRVER